MLKEASVLESAARDQKAKQQQSAGERMLSILIVNHFKVM